MQNVFTAALDDRAIISISGPDRTRFLQGLVTNDVERLETAPAIFAALLSPQGKILADFLIYQSTDGLLLDVAHEAAADLIKRLRLYKLRAEIEISDKTEAYEVLASWSDGDFEFAGFDGAVLTVADPRLKALGYRSVVARGHSIKESASAGDYHAHRIRLGVPEAGRDYLFASAYPHDVLMDLLGGVSFTKGCYVGQEVVSRMRHKDGVRKRCLIVEAGAVLPAGGGDIKAGAATLGQLGSRHHDLGLAIVRIDRLAEARDKGEPLSIDGLGITLRKPDWANFEL